MKKLTAILLSLALVICFAGCGEKDNSIADENGNTESKTEETVKGFDGKVNFKWDEVSEDYERLETEAEDELDKTSEFTRERVEEMAQKVEKGLKELENGITKDNKEVAYEVYKNAHKLEILAKKDKDNSDNDFLKLAKDTKAIIKQYHGEAEEDFEGLFSRIGENIDNIKNYTDDKWNEFLDMLKM